MALPISTSEPAHKYSSLSVSANLPSMYTSRLHVACVHASVKRRCTDTVPHHCMQVGEMQRLLDEAGIHHRDCFERGELLQRLGENEGRLQGDLRVCSLQATCHPDL